MTDQSIPPQFVDDESPPPPMIHTPRRRGSAGAPAASLPIESVARPAASDRPRNFWQTLDKPVMLVVGLLISLGVMMVYSTTFDWSFSDYGDPTVKAFEHARNVALSVIAACLVILFDYRRVRRLAVPIMLVAIAALVAVLIFGDDVFNARRSLIAGRFQPGELSELAIVIYMAAWLGSKSTRVASLTYGLIPFAVLVGIVCGLVALQPDLSTAIVIIITCGAMFFLAGADVVQLAVGGALALGAALLALVTGALPFYAQGRITQFMEGWGDITRADYHVLQAYIAFDNGGWFGVGLGQSAQKFNNALPAPHTDSIFAIIGEELGIVGAAAVVFLFGLLVWRGFAIARRAIDPFGALLAAGITIWIVSKALLNIAVMLALVPPTGIVLPFISFGGSSMMTLCIGVGLLLSVQRVAILKETTPERRVESANSDRRRRDRRARLSGASRSGGGARPSASV